MRAPMTIAFLALAAAGCGETPAPSDASVPPDGGPTCTTVLWNGPGSITRWPAPEILVDDPTTETGRRIEFDLDHYPDLATRLAGYRAVFEIDLATVDGFGINGEAFFQFDRHFVPEMIPSGEDTLDGTSGLGFVVFEPGDPRIVGVLVTTTDEGSTLMLAPMEPLPARGRAAAFVTRAMTDAAQGCLEPSPGMREVIESPDADTADAIAALMAVGAIESADDLVAITAFPTQSITEDSVAVAADVATRDYDFESPPVCTTMTQWIRCESTFVSQDYRDPVEGTVTRARGEGLAPQASYEVPITIWLPIAPSAEPRPVMVFGHGLTGDRYQAERLAEFAAPMGYVTVAIDALMHGDHPTRGDRPEGALQDLLGFFGLELGSDRTLQAARMRDHFRQSTWDKLQMTRLLRAHPDVDGDGTADLDVDRIAYLGVSLGGLMGPELLALSPDYGAGVLVVPGGRVSAIISDGAQFGALITAFRPRGTSEGDVRRFFPILQTVIERGDPASYGEHLLADRLPGAEAVTPSILAGVVLDDDTVPNVANYALVRAIGLPLIAPELRHEPGITVVPGPVVGNFAGGEATGGLLQFDVRGDGMGGAEMATHGNVGDSDVGVSAWLDFLDTHFAGGPPRIRDPYAEIGLEHGLP